MLSFTENIPIILSAINELRPLKVLDVGAGMGKYGLLIREQYVSNMAESGIMEPKEEIIIDAIEDTKYLITDRLVSIYNNVYKTDFFNSIDIITNGYYDLLLLIDTVEHWDKEKTISFLKEVIKSSPILISTPKNTVMYKEHYYGDSRHHISQWNIDDFYRISSNVAIIKSPVSNIIYIR